MALLYSQSFAAGTSTFCGAGHTSPVGTDPLYPEMREAETIRVTTGAGPLGENVIDAATGPANPYTVSGIWASYKTWALDYFDITIKVKPSAAALAEPSFYAQIFTLLYGTSTQVFSLEYNSTTEQLILFEGGVQIATVGLTKASISGVWQTFRFTGKNGTDNGDVLDGYLTVYRNGTQVFNQTGLALMMGIGQTPVATGFWVGYFGLLGQVTGISVADAISGVEVAASVIRRMRRAPHLSQENTRIFFARLQIDMETGLGLTSGQGSDPTLMLRWSDDGGQTWSNERTVSAGVIGAYKARVKFNRLGSARDRVFEISVTDPIPWRIVNAYLDVTAGAH